MKKIYKYPLLMGQTRIRVPGGSIVRDIMLQDGQPHIYLEIDANAEFDENQDVRLFSTYSTGQGFLDTNHKYVGSVQQTDVYGWHVYEIATG